jgi:NDP-4-keto-2,6-dideoxyhexose 3-C-methyltransferase
MENLFDRFGLECVDVSTSMVNGGVLRTVCQKKGVGVATKAVQAQRDIETAYGLDTDIPYRRFANNVKSTAHELKDLIDSINASGKKCYIYGASTRGGTIWQYVGLDVKDLPFAVERNPDKVGKKIASIGVPIISEEQARLDKPDYMLVSIWFFFDQVVEREQEYLNNGGRLIKVLPEIEVICKT